MDIWRVVELQTRIYEFNATSTDRRAEILRKLLEDTKPQPYLHEWHELIASQFRYPLPVPSRYQARFRPAGSFQNVYFAAKEVPTSLFEHAYYFLRLRKGMKKAKRSGQRTLFAARLIPSAQIADVSGRQDVAALTDPSNYLASHQFVQQNPTVKVIRYPSCRDPDRRPCYAVRDIQQLEKSIERETTISFSYDPARLRISWQEPRIQVDGSLYFPRPTQKPRRRSAPKTRSPRARSP